MGFADTQLSRPTRFGWIIVMLQTAPKSTSKFLSYASSTTERVNKCLLDAMKYHSTSYCIDTTSSERCILLLKWLNAL